MTNLKTLLLRVAIVCLGVCLGSEWLAGITNSPPLYAANGVGQQATDVPELVTPTEGAVTTGTSDPPAGVPSLVWTVIGGATKYNVQMSLSAGFASPTVDVTTAGLSFTPLTVLADGAYFWRVRAFNKEWGAFSTPRTFTKDWSDRGALVPRLLSPADNAERTAFTPADFSWASMPGAATYLLEIGPDANFTTATYKATTITPHHTPPQRLATNTYFWRVTPLDAQGHAGRPSNTNQFSFRWNLAPQLIAPADGLQASFVPTFAWTAVEGAKTYQLQVDTESDFPSPTLYTAYNTAFVWEKNLANDAEYFWRVQAIDEVGNTSEWSSTRSFRMRWNFKPQLLAPPNNSLTQAYPVFSWTPIPGIERYQIQVDESLSFATPLFDSKVYNNHTATITQFKEAIIYLKTAYYWRVRGIDSQDNLTPWSDIFTFEFDYTTSPNPVYPLPYYPPETSTLPVYADQTIAAPLFIWDSAHTWPLGNVQALAQAADYYELTVSTDPAFAPPPSFQIQTTGLAATPTLQNPFIHLSSGGQLYYWRVRAIRNGQPLGSDTVRTTRIDPNLSKLQATQLISPTYPADGLEAVGDPPVLGWLPVSGAANYKLELSHDRTFATVDETAYPQFANYVPGQGQLSHMPFGTYWWRVRAERAPDLPLGDWSAARHFNLSVNIASGNKYDFLPPAYPSSILTTGNTSLYAPQFSLVATNTHPASDQTMVDNLHVMLNRVDLHKTSLASNLDWIIAFSTTPTITMPLQYGIYIDVDHVENAGATRDPENHPISVHPLYLPEYVLYIDRAPGTLLSPHAVRLYKWNGQGWNPAQPLDAISGDAWYDPATHAVQVVVPYTAIGTGDEDFSGSLALMVFSTQAGEPLLDSVPAARDAGNPRVDNPVFVSDMPLPLFPFDTPLSNPTIYYELPTLRWRTPTFDSIDGYQLQMARDAKFTDVVETWEIYEQNTASYFAMLPAAFQSLQAYGDNESYYWRVRIRHERYDSNPSHFDYSTWSPPMRFKLASRLVGKPIVVATGGLTNTIPIFAWDRVEAAAGYTIQIDNDANFSNPEVNKQIDPNAFVLLDPLADGTWHWRVAIRRSDNIRGAWTPSMDFVKRSLTPTLLSPIRELTNNDPLTDTKIITEQPTFQWTTILTPTLAPRIATPRYQLQIAADPNFSSPKTYETAATSFTLKPADSLSDGTWYWRVAAKDGKGNVGIYSPREQFYKEYLPPSLLAPAQGITVTDAPSFQWSPLAGAASYDFELDDDPLFNSPVKARTDNTQYTPTDALAPKQYYWQVRMVDTDRQVGPFKKGLVAIKPLLDASQPYKLYLPLVAK